MIALPMCSLKVLVGVRTTPAYRDDVIDGLPPSRPRASAMPEILFNWQATEAAHPAVPSTERVDVDRSPQAASERRRVENGHNRRPQIDHHSPSTRRDHARSGILLLQQSGRAVLVARAA